MKHMRTGNNIGKRNIGPKFYILNDGMRYGRLYGLEKAIKVADTLGSAAMVYRLGTITRPVHIGGYE